MAVGLLAFAPVRPFSLAGSQKPRWRLVQSWPPLPPAVRIGIIHSVAVDGLGRILILHRGVPPVVRLERDGALNQAWGTGMFNEVHSLKIAPDGCIWVTDVARHIIVKFSADGQPLETLGTTDQAGEGPDHFGGPADLAFLPDGDFYVADGYLNSRVRQVRQEWEISLPMGQVR
jgi:hypothetical protein